MLLFLCLIVPIAACMHFFVAGVAFVYDLHLESRGTGNLVKPTIVVHSLQC